MLAYKSNTFVEGEIKSRVLPPTHIPVLCEIEKLNQQDGTSKKYYQVLTLDDDHRWSDNSFHLYEEDEIVIGWQFLRGTLNGFKKG